MKTLPNWMQKARKANLDLIKKWIEEGERDKAKLMKKAMLAIGCTERKAHEYIELLLGV